MTLSTEAQALFDHARNSIPRWLTRGKSTALEWLYAYVTEYDNVRTQGQTWLDITYILTASGANLDQHARDRGTSRRLNESDAALRLRLINITDSITQPALKGSIDAILASYSLGPCAFVNLRRDRGHYHIPYGNYPVSAVGMNSAVGYGTWSAGWLCDEASGNLIPAFGGANAVPNGSPIYGLAGPYGITLDKAVALSATTDYWDAGDLFNVGAGDDLAIAWIGKFTSLPSAYETIITRVSPAFSNGWAIYAENSVPQIGFSAGATAAYGSVASGSGAFCVNDWHVGIGAIDRSTGKICVGTLGLATAGVVGSLSPIINAVQVASTFKIGSSTWVAGGTNYQIAGVYAAYGASAALNIPANMSTALANFRKTLFPRKSTAFMSRGFRMTNNTRPMGYTVILPYGTTAGIASAIQDYLRQFGPGGFNYFAEVRANP